MPGNGIPDNIHNFFEHDNSSQGSQSLVGGGGWPIFNNNPWVGVQRQNGAQLTNNYRSQSTDSEHGNGVQPVQTPFSSNPSQKAEVIQSQPRNQRLNLNGYMHGSQGLQARSIQQEFLGDGNSIGPDGHSLTQRGFSTFENSSLTRSSGSTRAAESPVNFDFLGSEQMMGISQPLPIEPQRMNDMQLWQQQLMYKQLMQRQQQLLQLQGARQQNSFSSDQIPAVLSGMPINNNASHNMWPNELVGGDRRLPNMNWVQRSSIQGIPNGFMFSHDQVPQQVGESSYGTRVVSTGDSLSQQSQFRGTQVTSHDTTMQPSTFNYFQSDQSAGGTQENFQQMNTVSPSPQIQETTGIMHEKARDHVGPSNGLSNLGPTEEKLFNTDDDENIGPSFELNSNIMQSNDRFSSVPTMQSGSWSALMQEAVEASSSDTGLNEEWSGLSFQKTELHDNILTSRPLPLFSDADTVRSFQQPMDLSCRQNERVSTDASRDSFQQSSNEAFNRPFDRSHQQMQLAGGSVQAQAQFDTSSNGLWGGQQPSSSALSSEVGFNSHNMQHPWAHQQKLTSHSNSENKLNGWNTQSLIPTECYDNNDGRQHVQANDLKRTMNIETNHDGRSMWKVAGAEVATVGRRETVGSDTKMPMTHNENLFTNNLASGMNSSYLNMNHETNQQVLIKNQVNYENNVAFDVCSQNKKVETASKYQNQPSGSPQIWNSPVFNSQPRQRTEGGGSAGEGSLVAKNAPQSLVKSGLKSSGLSSGRNKGPHRFQFHPMGDIEMSSEPVGSQSRTSYSQGPSQSVVQGLKTQERGYAGHSLSAGHALDSALDMGKGYLSDFQRSRKAAEEMQYRGAFSSHANPAFNGSSPEFSQNIKTGSTSQNMLELLHKVDQSRVVKPVQSFGFSEQSSPSGTREPDSSDGSSSHLQLSQLASFQGFGLKLAPPSQRQTASDHVLPLHSINGSNQRNLDSGIIEEDQSRQLNSTWVPSQKENHGDKSFSSGHKSSGLPPTHAGPSQQKNASSDFRSSGQKNRAVEARSISHPSPTSSVSKQGGLSTMLHNVWNNISSQQRLSGGFHPQEIISNVIQSRSPLPSDNYNKRKGESASSANSQQDHPMKDDSSQQMPPPDRADVDPKTGSTDSSQQSSDAQKRNNYSLLQQMQVMKGADSDTTRRAEKRQKGADFGEKHIYSQNTVLRETDETPLNISFPSDAKMLSFSSKDTKENGTDSSLKAIDREVPSQDLQNHSHPHGKTLTEHPPISPQMAPLWFEKYGNYKNGQTLKACDGLNSFQKDANASIRTFIFPKISESMVHPVVPAENEVSIVGSYSQSTSSSIFISNQPVPTPGHSKLEGVDDNVILIPKKRKSATADLLPWHKEVTQVSRGLQNISIMEQKWAWATNRLVDKLEEDFEMIEDGLPMARSRRRLILTTQLTQQIFPSVPSRYLREDATMSYENVIYSMAKSILGDACNLISCSGSDSHADNVNMTSAKLNVSEMEGKSNHLLKFVEEVIGRSKNMEDDFLRLDRRASILDVRLECQDLERHSIMNRFAKFHGRSQSEGIESTSSSETASRRAYPQRYVTPHGIPRNTPEGVICLSL